MLLVHLCLCEFFKGLPKSLDEAAMLDGCGFFQIYYKILLPLLKPALSSLAILTAISTFKDLMWPLIVNNSMEKMTLSAGLAMLIGEHTTYYPQVMAGRHYCDSSDDSTIFLFPETVRRRNCNHRSKTVVRGIDYG